MASPDVLASLPINGGTSVGNDSKYAGFVPVLDTTGKLDASFINGVIPGTTPIADVPALYMGAGVPTFTPVAGSYYFRTNPSGSLTSIYQYQASAWVGIV